MNYVAFDLEIAKELPEGCEDWKAHRPLGISCAATLAVSPEGREEQRWHGAEQVASGRLADRMTPRECQGLALYLLNMASNGYQIVTWNGLGFDFDVLAEEVNDLDVWQALRDLALAHVDPAWQMLCEKGFMCGLEAAAKGMGLGKKFEDVHGADAPVLWKRGRDDQNRVLDYCAQDVALTAAVYDEIVGRRYLTWIKKDGRVSAPWRPTFYTPTEMAADRRLLTVTEALALPLPDTSWMGKPWSRSRFIGWTERTPGQETSNLADLVTALADARAKEEAVRAVVTDLGLKIAATELGIAHDAAHTALEAAQFATTEADGKLRDAALAAFDGNKHPHQAVEVAERTEVQYDPRRAVEIAMYQGWTNCLQIKAREFDRRAIAMAEARAKVPALLGEAVPEIDFQVRDMLTLEGVEIVKAPMVKVSRDLSEWATPADQLSLPIEEEASIE